MKKLKNILLVLMVSLLATAIFSACDFINTPPSGDGSQTQKPEGGDNGNQTPSQECEHIIVVDEAVEATCSQTGLTEGKHCSKCNKVLLAQETVEKKEHTEETDEAVEPTCSQTGLTEGKHCSVCKEVLLAQETVEKKEHTEETDEAVEPTCSQTGLTEGKHCSVCKEVLLAQETVEKKAHTEETDEAVEETCTQTGLTEGKHCSVCKEVLLAQETVEKKEHTFDKSAYDDNNHWKECVCGEKSQLTEHNFQKNNCQDCVYEKATKGMNYSLSADSSSYIITGLDKVKESNLIVPSAYNGIPVSGIASKAFYNCEFLKSVEIAEGVTSIGASAFYKCINLTSVEIPDSVEKIESKAFYQCRNLVKVTVGAGVKEIGGIAFFKCDKLIEVYNRSKIDIQMNSTSNGCVGYYAKNIYTPTSGKSNIIKENDYLFYNDNGNYYLMVYLGDETDIVLPESVQGNKYSTYDSAFWYCSKLRSVVISDGVTAMGVGTFYLCTGLKKVVISDSVKEMGGSTFMYCYDLEEVKLGNSIEKIMDFTFFDCNNLTSIVIPDSVTYIDTYNAVFRNCYSLESVVIGNGVKEISGGIFGDSKKLTSVVLGTGLREISSGFQKNTTLKSVVFKEPTQWFVGDRTTWTAVSSTDLSNPTLAAEYLKTTYCDKIWRMKANAWDIGTLP